MAKQELQPRKIIVDVGHKGNYYHLYSIGYLDEQGNLETNTNKMMITGTKPSSTGYEPILKDYNEAIYNYGTIPEYKINITQIPSNKTRFFKQFRA